MFQLSVNCDVLPPALANAALLIAAPSLGCLNTYTTAITDLCRSYGLPVPDLAQVLEYRPTTSPSTKELVSCSKETHNSTGSLEPKAELVQQKMEHECKPIKDEFESSESESIAEVDNDTNSPVENPQITLVCKKAQPVGYYGDDNPTTIDMKRPRTRRDCSKRSSANITQVRVPVSKEPEQPSPVIENCLTPPESPQYLNDTSYSEQPRDSTPLPQNRLYNILHNNGKSQATPSLEEAKMILSHCRMPVKYAKSDIQEPINCGMYVTTIEQGSVYTPFLHIHSKRDGWTNVGLCLEDIVPLLLYFDSRKNTSYTKIGQGYG